MSFREFSKLSRRINNSGRGSKFAVWSKQVDLEHVMKPYYHDRFAVFSEFRAENARSARDESDDWHGFVQMCLIDPDMEWLTHIVWC